MFNIRLAAIISLLFSSTAVYGATISTSGCGGRYDIIGQDVQEKWCYKTFEYGSASAHTFASIPAATVRADWDVNASNGSVWASAYYDNSFEITFLGGSGSGYFVPCFELSTSGLRPGNRDYSTATATLTIGGTSHVYQNSTCPNEPTGIPFQFGEPVQFHVALAATGRPVVWAGSSGPTIIPVTRQRVSCFLFMHTNMCR